MILLCYPFYFAYDDAIFFILTTYLSFLAEQIKEIKERINEKEEAAKFLSIDADSVF